MNRDEVIQRYHELSELIDSYEYRPCPCEDYKEIRLRYFGGGRHYVYQCTLCGEQRGGSLKSNDALKLLNGVELKEFDPKLAEMVRNRNSLKAKEVAAIHKEMWDLERLLSVKKENYYHALSPDVNFIDEYQATRKKLEKSLDAIKEELIDSLGEEVAARYLTNAIVSIRKKQYLENVKSTDRFTCEDELKRWLVKYLSEDFDLFPEVCGYHQFENVNVRIDFIAFPKKHLIDKGFCAEPFGIEVKYFNQENGFTRKTSRGFWQAISYNDCWFDLNGHSTKLKFSLLFSNLAFEAEMKLVRNYGYNNENDVMEWIGMLHLANHANVGLLGVYGDKHNCLSWAIKFAGGVYFSASKRPDKIDFRLSNSNVINKVRIGNF
ncbi:hypothetical protein [Shewanella algae]|uniref:hypothetical protein n=1 Tax=Shewanella algae TaxID=38313 RepID=UPI00399C3DEE